MRRTLIIVVLLGAQGLGCGKPPAKVPVADQSTADRTPHTRSVDSKAMPPGPGDTSWIADTPIAKRLVSLGFVKSEDGYIYKKDMTLAAFRDAFGNTRLMPVPASSAGEWLRRTTIDGNHTALRWQLGPERPPYEPSADTVIAVGVNVEFNRRPSFSVGYPWGAAHHPLLHLGATEITARVSTRFDDDAAGQRWSRWYLLPDNTCLVVRIVNRSKPRSKPVSPGIAGIILGETGRGYVSAEDWAAQDKSILDTLPLNQYRRELK